MKPLLLRQYLDDPDLHLVSVNVNTDKMTFVQMSERRFREETFLNHQLASSGDFILMASLKRFLSSADELGLEPRPVNYVVNTGYCCSTLVARALESMGGFFVLKEPRCLDDLNVLRLRLTSRSGIKEWERMANVVLWLLTRTYRRKDAAVIKAYTLDNPALLGMLKFHADSKVLFLYSTFEEFLVNVLKDERRIEDIRGRARQILESPALHQGRFGTDLSLPPGRIAALCWLYENYSHLELAKKVGNRAKALRTDSLLGEPVTSLSALAAHFGGKVSESRIRRLAQGKAFHAHSKTGVDYGSEWRKKELRKLSGKYGSEVDDALAWMEKVVAKFPVPEDRLPSDILRGRGR